MPKTASRPATLGMFALSLLLCTASLPAHAAEASEWVKSVARAIAAKQTYPRVAQMRGEEGTARIKLFVSASGTIEHTELVGHSGSSTLDKEALALPSREVQLPAPPGGATTVTIPITWKLL